MPTMRHLEQIVEATENRQLRLKGPLGENAKHLFL